MEPRSNRLVRPATAADAAGCAAIYAPYVTDTTITFETEVPTTAQMAGRIANAQRAHAWLVLVEDGAPVGFAYGAPFKARAAYRWSCEVSIYLAMGMRRSGAGRALYTPLLERLAERGYRRAFAGITQPNAASSGLHHAFDFTEVALFSRVGWKHGGWHDVAWLQRDLLPADRESDPPTDIM
jgi:phosphinothricin acetyltransferase